MAPKTRTKIRGANLPVPQSREEAADMVRQIGEDQRALERIDTQLKAETAALKDKAEAEALPIKDRITARTEGIKHFAEGRRHELTNNGKTKTIDLGTGKLSWRSRPPKVTIRGVDDVIARLKELGMTIFLRTKEEIDKEAMIKDPKRAASISGVTVGSEGEDFIIEPYAAELSEVRP